MSHRIVRGFAWIAHPDTFGLDEDAPVPDPGHPFAPSPGTVLTPEEVLYFRPLDPADTGIQGAPCDAYLVISRLQLHPRLCTGWDSDPAALNDKFKTADGRVKMARIVQVHRRHVGDLIECELRIEEAPSDPV